MVLAKSFRACSRRMSEDKPVSSSCGPCPVRVEDNETDNKISDIFIPLFPRHRRTCRQPSIGSSTGANYRCLPSIILVGTRQSHYPSVARQAETASRGKLRRLVPSFHSVGIDHETAPESRAACEWSKRGSLDHALFHRSCWNFLPPTDFSLTLVHRLSLPEPSYPHHHLPFIASSSPRSLP